VRRVVITGMGVVSPVGIDRRRFFESLVESRSGVRAIELPLKDRLKARLGAQIADFDAAAHIPKERLSQLDRFSQFAVVAAREAWSEARLPQTGAGATCGVYFGTSIGGAAATEAGYDDLFRKDLQRVRPLTVVNAMPNAAAAHVAMTYGITGPTLTYSVACASSAVAVGEAYRAIAAGAFDRAIAGGSESMLVYGVIKGWEALTALATENADAPETSCRPFAQDRSGLVLGEGAAALVLEELEQALARGAQPIAEIVGYGISNDAVHLSRPEVDGQTRAMRMALAEARRHRVELTDIGYVNAHGTATKVGDKVENEALKTIFGDHASRLAVSSTKALHGHMMGAAGAAELIAAVMALEARCVPPTAHLWKRDPECDLDYLPLEARRVPGLRAVMSNSFSFGGTNAVLVASAL
jgi:3-oxoacyl-[acyl-carrier-protein] synthase II